MTYPQYAAYFIRLNGIPLCYGFVAALVLSRFSGLSLAVRSRGALVLAFLAVAVLLLCPTVSDGPADAAAPGIVLDGFGFAFALARLRLTGGKSVSGWGCAVILGLALASGFWDLYLRG